jgi:hypothetical protein
MNKEEEEGQQEPQKTITKKATGINLIDSFSPQDRKLQRRNAGVWWQSLTHERRVEVLQELKQMIREKIKQHGGMITEKEAIREFLNVDFPRSLEAAAQEMEQAGYLEIARDIRQRRWCVDTFELEVIDDPSLPRGVVVSEGGGEEKEES